MPNLPENNYTKRLRLKWCLNRLVYMARRMHLFPQAQKKSLFFLLEVDNLWKIGCYIMIVDM